MVRFEFEDKSYSGDTALDALRSMAEEAEDYPHSGRSLRLFLAWSLEQLADRLPPRDLDLSDRLDMDELALAYFCLRDEFGVGKLSISQAAGTITAGS